MFLVEIVSHCWAGGPNGEQYAKLLRYQIRSLIEHQPKLCNVKMTICVAPEHCDPVAWAAAAIDPIPLGHVYRELFVSHKEFALQRPWGRNAVALNSMADIVFFSDCDYLFGEGCLDSLVKLSGREELLFFPEATRICRDHATGDKYIAAGEPLPIDPADFIYKKERKAIGGIQICPGDIARQYGYCKDVAKLQRPAPPECNTIVGFHGDSAFRRILGTSGTPFQMPNLFRLRHSATGDGRVPKELADREKE